LSRDVVFMPAARLDVLDAHAWYERKAARPGARFLDEIDAQVVRISPAPLHFPEVRSDVRRARLRRFPYGLFFRNHAEGLFVIACFHSSRDPIVWQSRT
jgi:hypothetical protein